LYSLIKKGREQGAEAPDYRAAKKTRDSKKIKAHRQKRKGISIENDKNIGERIAKLRKLKNWTQNELAEQLYVTDKAVSKWENCNGDPGIEFIPVLSDLFGVTTDYLLTGQNPPEWLDGEKTAEWRDLSETLALKSVGITGDALGRFGLFTVRQAYENTTDKTLEVFYTFPLSKSASVYNFQAKIGDKTLRGAVKEKKEAKREYQRAIVAGNSAYLLERENSNVFKMTVGKIAPGERAELSVSYIDAFEITTIRLKSESPP
jgi:transcriptional regulator with XRE-family HTH domain